MDKNEQTPKIKRIIKGVINKMINTTSIAQIINKMKGAAQHFEETNIYSENTSDQTAAPINEFHNTAHQRLPQDKVSHCNEIPQSLHQSTNQSIKFNFYSPKSQTALASEGFSVST